MTRKPRFCNPTGTDPPALFESRDAPTTAITVDDSRISLPVLLTTTSSPRASCDIPRLDSEERLPRGVAADLFAPEPITSRVPLRHRTRDVGSDGGVGRRPQGLVEGQPRRV